MSDLLVNIDVDDLESATRFYCEGLGLHVGQRFGSVPGSARSPLQTEQISAV